MNEIKQYGKVAVTFDGEFNPNKSYERLCVVEYAGMSFISKVDGTTSIPTQNKNEWLQLSVPGPKGDKGDQGVQGNKGDKGDYGPKGISTAVVTVYKSSETKPDKPIGGVYDFIGGLITYPEGWSSTDNLEKPIWQSTKVFHENNEIVTEWSDPFKITGDDGKAGKDGVNMEFIYKITKRPTIVPDISNMPSENINDYVPIEFGWSDTPNGVDPVNRIEWVCTRKKINGVWSQWEGPTIWSAYGEKGQDGDGVEYIYYLENTGYPPENPTPDDWETNDDYQNPDIEYVPSDLGWTDSPKGVSQDNMFEWQAQRKFRNGYWSKFTNPTLWSKYGDKGNIGDRILEMFAETEDHDPPHVVKDNINPGSIWSIAPPVAFDPSKGGAIWSIYTYVDYKNEFVEYEVVENEETIKVSGWSDPIIKTGYNGINPNYRTYIYKKSDEKPELPTFTDPTKFEEAGWKDAPYDDVDGDGSVDIKGRWWECSGLVNGESEEVEWEYVREINGSNSKALFQVTTSSKNAPSCNNNNINPGDNWSNTYKVTNPYEYVWIITAEIDSQGNLVGEWQGPTCISGETPEINENGDVIIGGEDTGVNLLNLHLELDNDSEIIPTDSEGNTIGSVSAITSAQLYSGSKLITEGVTYSAIATKCTLKETENTTGIFEVVALDSGTDVIGYYIEITATYKNIGISKKFNISKSLGNAKYKIQFNKSVINLDEANNIIEIEVYKTDGNINKKLSVIPEDYGLYFYNGQSYGNIRGEYNRYGKYTTTIVNTITENIYCRLYDNNGNLLDYEEVGLVKNGTSIKIKGSLTSVNQLPTVPTDESDCYVIGLDIYCWDSTKIEWFNAGQFKGVDGKAPQISSDGYWEFWNGNEYEKTEFYAIGDGHLPYIGENGNWFEWDESTKSYKDTGFAAKGDNGTSYYMHVAYSNNADGTDFVYGSNVVTDYEYIGIYTGTQSDQSNLVKTDYKWTKHKGATGKTGASGIPGVSIYVRYQRGNANGPINSTLPSSVNGNSNFWTTNVPTVTETYPYIWCTQGSKIYTSENAYYYSWSEPFRLSGINGLDGIGDKGDPGKIIYPAGIYNNTKTYVATETKAPYVWDPSYGAYYVYLSTTPWKGTDQNDLTPGQEYAANKDNGTNKWELFEQFEAVYAKIGIIANGLIGSAVFNGDYMFSQQGVDIAGNFSDDYENFMKKEDGSEATNPYSTLCVFRPNFCIDFKRGYTYFGTGRTVITSDGSMYINRDLNTGSVDTNGISKHRFLSDGSFWLGSGSIVGTANGNINLQSGSLFLNQDGSGYLGKGAISWDIDGNVYLGTGDDKILLNNIDKDINIAGLNEKHYTVAALSGKITIEQPHLNYHFLYRGVTSLTIDIRCPNVNKFADGYLGTYNLVNVNNSDACIALIRVFDFNGNMILTSSISIPSKSIKVVKVYTYGLYTPFILEV